MTVVSELRAPELARVPPLRHLFHQPGPPRLGDRAVCGAVCGGGSSSRNPSASREHCVVCVELARARGWTG